MANIGDVKQRTTKSDSGSILTAMKQTMFMLVIKIFARVRAVQVFQSYFSDFLSNGGVLKCCTKNWIPNTTN